MSDNIDDSAWEELPECDPLWAQIDRATTTRKHLLVASYRPIPVVGKEPPLKGWSDITATDALIDRWATQYAGATNTGIITADTPAIDIDVLDSVVANELHQLAERMIGPSPVRTGRPPKRALIYRADKPFKKISTPIFTSPDGRAHKIEVLGWGQQIVVHGIHPDTGKPYTWSGGTPGPGLPRSALTLLTAEKVIEFIAAATALMSAQPGWIATKKTNGAGNGHANGNGFAFTQNTPVTERERLYARAALEGCAEELAAAPSGTRNDVLNKKAFRLGTMLARDWISRSEVETELFAAAAANGLNADDGEKATEKTI